MNKNKLYKIISSVMAVLLLCGMFAGAAFAQEETSVPEAAVAGQEPAVDIDTANAVEEETQEEETEKKVQNFPFAGMKFTYPEEYLNLKGTIEFGGGVEIEDAPGIYVTDFLYMGMSPEEVAEIETADELTDEQIYDYLTSEGIIAYVYGINGNRGAKELMEYFQGIGAEVSEEDLKEIGKAGDCTFYLLQQIFDWNYMKEEYAEEFTMLLEHPEYISDNLEFYEPKIAGAYLDDNTLSFETTDIYGNKVTSEELFSGKKVTMLNIWATWCGFCIDEMDELEEISKRAAEKDCQVVGILQDGTTPAKIQEGIDIMEKLGITYTVILPWEGFESQMVLMAFPTTYFADSEGRLLGDPILGAYVDEYEARIDEELAQMQE